MGLTPSVPGSSRPSSAWSRWRSGNRSTRNWAAGPTTSKREEPYEAEVIARYGVRGVIDAIHNLDGETILIDYKTSKKAELDNNCVIQLAIYTLLHKERYGKMPNKVGIHFLRHGEKIMPTSTQLLMLAKRTIHKIHHLTKHETINKYPKKISGLCKYKTGQCDYYEECMGRLRN